MSPKKYGLKSCDFWPINIMHLSGKLWVRDAIKSKLLFISLRDNK